MIFYMCKYTPLEIFAGFEAKNPAAGKGKG